MAALEVRGVDVAFGGLKALQGVHLGVEAGAITGLIGPNGAGKTTLFNVICGYQAPNSGGVYLDGSDISRLRPHQRARRGIARTFQRLETFGSLSVRDNILVAAEMSRQQTRQRFDCVADTERIIDVVGLRSVAEEQVDALPTGQARLVELGRALAIRPSVLLLDEPSSGLNDRETHDLGQLLLQLASQGVGVLMVEHDIDLVMNVCSHLYVLNFGKILTAGSPEEVRNDPAVRTAYLGSPEDAVHPV